MVAKLLWKRCCLVLCSITCLGLNPGPYYYIAAHQQKYVKDLIGVCVYVCVIWMTSTSPEWDEHVEGLISLLHSQTSLVGIDLYVSSLTERCAASVVSLSQACPNLRMISWVQHTLCRLCIFVHICFSVTVQLTFPLFSFVLSLHVVEHGLLLEEVLQRLRVSKRHPDCRLLVAGYACTVLYCVSELT